MKNTRRQTARIRKRDWFKAALSFLFFLSSSQIFTLLILLPPPPDERERRRLYKLLLWWYASLIIRTHMNIRFRMINPLKEDFSKPAVMIANHQSILDVPATLMLSSKILIVTNNWSQNSMFRFFIGKYIDIFSVERGLENYLDEFRKWLAKGYQILIFPEGVRWGSGRIERFHKGAFYLAEKLQADILPVLLHGTGSINSPRPFYLKRGRFSLRVLPRIKPGDPDFGSSYQERTLKVMQMYRREYRVMAESSL